MLITTYYVRGIRNVWTSYCLSPILTPYLYTRERKTYQQHHSLDAYCSLFKFDRFFSYLFYLLYKKERIYIRSFPHIYGAKLIIQPSINPNTANSSIKTNKLHAHNAYFRLFLFVIMPTTEHNNPTPTICRKPSSINVSCISNIMFKYNNARNAIINEIIPIHVSFYNYDSFFF